MRCVRIIFTKTGRVRYISHLDLMRCMTRAVRRADIPLWYTEGFNPHPYLNFLLPLSLGVDGVCEPLDIRIEGNITDKEIMTRLNDVLPEGITVTKVYEPFMKPNDIAYASYIITYDGSEMPADKLDAAMTSGRLVCEKFGKVNGRKRIKQVDISSGIVKFGITEENGSVYLSVVLPAGNDKSVNPVHLIQAVNNHLGTDAVPLNTRRVKIFDKNMADFE